MAMIEKIRRQGWLVLVVVGVGIIGYLIPYDAVMALMGKGAKDAGEIDGETIDAATWQVAIEKQRILFDYSSNETSLGNDTWNALTEERLYSDEFDAMDIMVSDEELDEVMFGKTLSPFVKSTIYGGRDSSSYKEQMRTRFETIDPNDPTWTIEKADSWKEFIRYKRKKEKYDNMIKLGAYTNSIDAKYAFQAQNDRTAVEFVSKSYLEIKDEEVSASDEDIREYYNKHKSEREYKQERSRSLEYVNYVVKPSESDLKAIKTSMESLVREFRAAKNDSAFAAAKAMTPALAKVRYTAGMLPEPFNTQVYNDSLGKVLGPIVDNGSMKLVKISKRISEVDSVAARHILIKDSSPKGKAKADSILNVIKAKKNFAEMAKMFGTDGTKDKGGDLGTFSRGAMVPEFDKACFNGTVGQLQIVKTQFGYHVVEVTKKNAAKLNTYVAMIDQTQDPSSQTRKEAFNKMRDLTINCKDTATFRANVKAMDATAQIVKAPMITPNATTVAGLQDAQTLVSWAYSAEINEVSQPVLIGNGWVVAVLTEVRERGVPAFEDVKDVMKAKVIKEKKGEMWAAKMKGSSLQDIAKATGLTVKRSENVMMRNANLPEAGIGEQEFALIGTIFGLAKDKVSEPIIGEGGVYVIKRVADVQSAQSMDNYASEKKMMNQSAKASMAGRVFGAYRESADIDDRRFINE
jgi:peptidyl-prolyl cis-trans isomerase D